MGATIEWRGLDKLITAINNSSPETIRQADRVLKNKAEKGKSVSKKLAPVRKINGGFLRDHIVVHHKFLEAEIHSQASYSGYQEWGTRFQPGTQYIRPMLEEITPEFQQDMVDVMKGAFK